jgi:hypothetical protein
VSEDRFEVAFFPSMLTATVATLGYSGWLRFRRGSFPAPRYIGSHFVFSLVASYLLTVSWLDSRNRSQEALRRMIAATEGRIEITAADSNTSPIPTAEFDHATGVDGERESERLLAIASNSTARKS